MDYVSKRDIHELSFQLLRLGVMTGFQYQAHAGRFHVFRDVYELVDARDSASHGLRFYAAAVAPRARRSHSLTLAHARQMCDELGKTLPRPIRFVQTRRSILYVRMIRNSKLSGARRQLREGLGDALGR